MTYTFIGQSAPTFSGQAAQKQKKLDMRALDVTLYTRGPLNHQSLNHQFAQPLTYSVLRFVLLSHSGPAAQSVGQRHGRSITPVSCSSTHGFFSVEFLAQASLHWLGSGLVALTCNVRSTSESRDRAHSGVRWPCVFGESG